MLGCISVEGIASFSGSPSFRAIILRMTFDPPERKVGQKWIMIVQTEESLGTRLVEG